MVRASLLTSLIILNMRYATVNVSLTDCKNTQTYFYLLLLIYSRRKCKERGVQQKSLHSTIKKERKQI